MLFRDLRAFLTYLEANGELARIKKEVNPVYEIGAVCRHASNLGGPALLFDKVKGSRIPVLANLWTTRKRLAMALGVAENEILNKSIAALGKRIPPKHVTDGPCKEAIATQAQVDLSSLPIPTWNEGERPYVTAGIVITRDQEMGYNAGIYRMQVKSKNRMAAWIAPDHHGRLYLERALQRSADRIDLVVAIGAEPAIQIAAPNDLPSGEDEFAVAGAIKGEPIEVVKCETVDLVAPASSEIVIEGHIPLAERELEGPFGEGTGFQTEAGDRFAVNVTAITMRKDAIFHGIYSGKPPVDARVMGKPLDEALALKTLRAKFPLLKAIHLPQAAREATLFLQINENMKKPGLVKNLMLAATFAFPRAKIVVAVDDDIDLSNIHDILWAIGTTVRPERDIEVVSGTMTQPIDPSSTIDGISGKVYIDATKKPDFRGSRPAAPPKEVLEYVKRHWTEYGIG